MFFAPVLLSTIMPASDGACSQYLKADKMLHFFTDLDLYTSVLLLLALAFVLFYEAINGFHDTANAVATVIYTRAMQSQLAVMMAAVFNFFGVLLGGLTVAYAIVHLLPTDLLLNVGSGHGLIMMFSLLLAAILWNLGTWYLGLPASSSHTLIGAIIGIGITNALLTDGSLLEALNMRQVISIFMALILSPLVGLLIAGGLVWLLRRYWNNTKKRARIHLTPAEREKQDGKRKPPFWVRTALIFSAAGVSFSHGANDGQKGIGLVMLVLIGVAPAGFVMNMNASGYDIARTRDALTHIDNYFQQHQAALVHLIAQNPPQLQELLPIQDSSAKPESANTTASYTGQGALAFHCDIGRLLSVLHEASALLSNITAYDQLTVSQRSQLRRQLLCIGDSSDKIAKLPEINITDQRYLKKLRHDLLNNVEYAPTWIIMAVALALGLGTMIGWRRVAVTIGEKIGKKGMTYAQGLSAQVTTALSIGIASYTGMPVSTTHVLSSSVAGTMFATGDGVQRRTIKNILLAWVFTLPASITLSGMLYWLGLLLFG